MSKKLQVVLSLGFLGLGLFVGSRFQNRPHAVVAAEREILSEFGGASAQDHGSDRMLAVVATKLAAIEARLARLDSGAIGGEEVPSTAAVPLASPPQNEPVSPVAAEAKQDLQGIVDANIRRGFWSDKDRDRFQALLAEGHLSEDEYSEISRRVMIAVNRQELKVETPGFPLMPIVRR